MAIKLPQIYSQLDPKWEYQKLGTSSVTLGGFGCLVSVMAMVACYYGKKETPATLDTWLTQNKGYQSRNLYKWFEGLTKKYPDIKCEGLFGVPYPLNKTQEAEIANELSNNRPVVVQVDYNPMTAVLDGHWCLIVDKKYGVYQIADPLEYPAKIVPMTKYGKQATTINYFVEHSGVLLNNMYESEDLQEYLEQHTKLVDECITKEKKIKELEKEFELANRKINKLIVANSILENKAEADLAKANLDFTKELADEKVAFKGELESIEDQHRNDLLDLEEQYKGVKLPEPEPKLTTFKQKLAKAFEILFS